MTTGMKPPKPSIAWMFGFWVSVATMVPCEAAIVLDIRDTTIRAGGVGAIEIYARSTDEDRILAASYRIRITPIDDIGGDMEFLPGSNSSLDLRQRPDEHNDPSYLFFGRADGSTYSAIRQVDTQQLVGSDSTSDFGDVVLTTAERLLARVELQHTTSPLSPSSGRYQVSIIEDPAQTSFVDINFNTLTIDPTSYDLTNSPSFGSGIVRVVAIPEPASLVALAVFGGLVTGHRRWRKGSPRKKP